MNILFINSILYTSETRTIKKNKSIKDTLCYNLVEKMNELGHSVDLLTALDFKPDIDEEYSFKISFLKSNFKFLFPPHKIPLHLSLLIYILKYYNRYDYIISSELLSFNSVMVALLCPKRLVVWHELALHPKIMFKIPSRLFYFF